MGEVRQPEVASTGTGRCGFVQILGQIVSIIVKTLRNTILVVIRDGPLEKLWGGKGIGIFEPQEFFSLSNSLYESFLGHSMNIF